MTLAPLLAAPAMVQLHVLAALLALGLGPVALYRRRRDLWHRTAGRVWVAAMAVTAATALGIPADVLPVRLDAGRAGGGVAVGPIHLLVPLVFLSLWQGVAAIRRGDSGAHARTMRSLYWNAIGVAGLFTLLPGRVMNAVVFPAVPEAGYMAVAAGGAALVMRAIAARRGGWPGRNPVP